MQDPLFTARLAASSLSDQDAKELGLYFLPSGEAAAVCGKSLASMGIPYFNADGSPMLDDAGVPFFRLRFLEFRATPFAKGGKSQRYYQPAGTAPMAYFPRVSGIDWVAVCKDAEYPILITEGELKAAKACVSGFATIGIGGVHSWRALKRGVDFLPSLCSVNFRRRNVYVVFDSDARTNTSVLSALNDLAAELQSRGAICYVVILPSSGADDDKTGLDDYLIANGNKALEHVLHVASPWGLCRVLWDYNAEYTYVRDPGLIVSKSQQKISANAFVSHLEAAKKFHRIKTGKDGEASFEAVSASKEWITWPLRNERVRMVYDPSCQCGDDVLNTWQGWGVEPVDGDVAPFLALLDSLMGGAEPEAREWLLDWFAYPLQNPGAKLFTSVVLYGIRQGTGKSFLGLIIGKIYGKNFTEISQATLHGSFNEWAEGRQFVLGDDVTGSDKRAEADVLKKTITQSEVRINAKFLPTYVMRDCINYFFTSNRPDSFFLDDDDRRFFVHEVAGEPLSDAFYRQLDAWYRGDGCSHLFAWLLKRDLSKFNPHARAYRTLDRERMIEVGRSDLASWVRSLKETPEDVLKIGKLDGGGAEKDLYTAAELLLFYDPVGASPVKAQGMARELARAGVMQACGGRKMRVREGVGVSRLYVLRNHDRWANASLSDVSKHLQA